MLQQAPTNLKALNLLGIALTGAGKVAEGNAAFEKALAIDARFHPARKNLAINEFNRGRLSVAERQLVRVVAEEDGDEVAHLYLGEIAVQKGACGKAVAHFAKAGRYASSRPDFTLHHGVCLLQTGAITDGVALLETLPPEASAQRFDAAVAIGRAQQYAEAARLFGSVRGSYKDPYAAGYNQLLMLINGGDFAAAAVLADELLAAEPRRAELQSLAAQAFAKAGRVKDAYDALRAATVLEPDEPGALSRSGQPLHRARELRSRARDRRHRPAEESRIVGPAASAWGAVGDEGAAAAGGGGVRDRATHGAGSIGTVRGARDGLDADGTHAESGGDASCRGAPPPARSRRAVHVRGGPDAVRCGSNGARGRGSGHGAARIDSRECARSRPAHSELGRLLLKRDDVDGAITELEQATDLDPEATAALYNLAQAYRRKGDRDRAADLLARVTRLNAEKRGDDPDRELRQIVVRIVREGSGPEPAGAP